MALARKFWLDYPQCRIVVCDDVRAATEREESNNPNRDDWDLAFGGGEEGFWGQLGAARGEGHDG